MTLYFAYGSNMDRAAMAQRCPSAVALGAARLDGWRYIIGGDGYASIVPAVGASVHGVLWRLGPRDLAALNAYENLDSGLYRRRMLSVARGGKRVRALTYVGRNRTVGRARPRYHAGVVSAARDWALPAAYVAQITRWANRSGARR